MKLCFVTCSTAGWSRKALSVSIFRNLPVKSSGGTQIRWSRCSYFTSLRWRSSGRRTVVSGNTNLELIFNKVIWMMEPAAKQRVIYITYLIAALDVTWLFLQFSITPVRRSCCFFDFIQSHVLNETTFESIFSCTLEYLQVI